MFSRKFQKLIITTFTFIFTYLHVFPLFSPIKAAVIEKTYTRTFELTSDFVKVSEIKEIKITSSGWVVPAGSKEYFTIFNPFENDPESESKLKHTLDSIKVTDGQNNTLKFTQQKTINKNVIIQITIPREISMNAPSTIKLSYNSYGLMIKSGAVRDIYIPGFPTDYSFQSDQSTENVKTTVVIPNTLPELNFVSPEAKITKSATSTAIQIDKNSLLGNTTWIQLGVKQYYKFDIEQTIPKSTELPFANNSIKLPIPRDIESGPITQKVYFEEISPEPSNIQLDKDDNLIATFNFAGNKDNVIKVKGVAISNQNKAYSFENSGKVSDVPNDLRSYLTPGEFWEVEDSEILAAAEKIKGKSTEIGEIIDKTFKFVVDKIDYSYVKKYGLNERQGALKTLNGRAAVCMEYSDLFITLLRAQGVPARAAFGYGFSALEYESTKEDTLNHQWAEVYVPSQKKWVSIDTTWGEFGNDLVGGDLNHFFSHVASVNPETPSTTAISYIGKIENLPELAYKVKVDDIPNESNLNSFQTQSQVLEKYPSQPDNSFVATISNKVSEIIRGLQEAVIITFHVDKPVANLILTLIGFTLLCLFFFPSFRRRGKGIRVESRLERR